MPQYFDANQSAAHRQSSVELRIGERTVSLATDSGVFSADRLDPGTAILLDTLPDPPRSGNLVDIGCGYGPIALWLALRAPTATVWGVEVNERARELATANAAAAGAGNVRIREPGQVPAGIRFAAIVSNPPIRIGKAALHELLLGWLPRLDPDGAAYLVVQKHLGADSLAGWLTEQEYHVQRVRSRKAYRVLQVRAAAPSASSAGQDRGRFDRSRSLR